MTDTIPGLKVHEHEGKFAGGFELPPADLATVTYDGRTMLVVVADVGAPLRITQDKDGLNKVHWTFDVADVAIVRDEGTRDHLSKALHLHSAGVDPHPLDTPEVEVTAAQSAARPTGMIGLYDKEGAFLGFQETPPKVVSSDSEERRAHVDAPFGSEERIKELQAELKRLSNLIIPEDDPAHEVYEARGSDESPPPPKRNVYVPGEEVVERIGEPIPIRDPVLAKSLERGIDG